MPNPACVASLLYCHPLQQDPNEVIDKYGADALRLYLINSPVVRAETLRFKEDGVFGVVKDVFLPWYNAYRFLVQNVLRMESESGKRFDPAAADLTKADNVLDRYVCLVCIGVLCAYRRIGCVSVWYHADLCITWCIYRPLCCTQLYRSLVIS